MTNEIKMCSYCGKKKLYAKGLCKNCYARNRYNGTPAPTMKNHIDLGTKFGRLEVVEKLDKGFYRCKCDCGKTTVTRSFSLRSGETRSCGCFRKERRQKYFDFVPRTKKQKVVYDLYVTGMTYGEIGAQLGMSRQAVGSILKYCAVNRPAE